MNVRFRPFLVANILLLAGLSFLASTAGPLAAEEPVRLAQRWTPLTGVLTPEGDGADKSPAGSKSGASISKKPAEASKSDGVQSSDVTLNLALVRTVSDGQPHGGLPARLTAVDADFADAVGVRAGQGALVTETTAGSTGLLAGDVIQSFEGSDVASPDALAQDLKRFNPDQQVRLKVWRAGSGTADLKRLLVERSNAGNVGAAASLGRLLSLGIVLGPKNFDEAATYYLRAAEAGHVGSMTRYGLFAKDGIGIPKDEAVAARWFLKAAEGGQEAAMTNLGLLYEAGRGVPQDYAKAAGWYREAVDKGHVFAMHKLALLYEAGRGVPKDDQEAARLLEQASENGLSEATAWLADKYEQGRGIPKDDAQAYRLNARAAEQVRRAAEQGNAVATFNLGILYRIGKGVKKSETEAAYWVVRSLKLGDKYLVAELMRNPNVLTIEDRKWLQTVLRDEGAYKGPINGEFSAGVRTAMEELGSKV